MKRLPSLNATGAKMFTEATKCPQLTLLSFPIIKLNKTFLKYYNRKNLVLTDLNLHKYVCMQVVYYLYFKDKHGE